MKHVFLLILTILILSVGCAPADGGPSNDPADTASPTLSLTPEVTFNTPNASTLTPEVTVSEAPIEDVFGFVSKVNGDIISVTICEIVYHMSDDLDKYGEPYGNDWVEIVDTGKTVELNASSNCEYIYVDLFSLETDHDGKYKFKNITKSEFLNVCIKDYFDVPLYFNFKYINDQLILAEFYLHYYISG